MAIHREILKSKASLCVRLFLLLIFFPLGGHTKNISYSDEQVAFNYFLDLEFDSCLLELNQIHNTSYALYLESLIEATRGCALIQRLRVHTGPVRQAAGALTAGRGAIAAQSLPFAPEVHAVRHRRVIDACTILQAAGRARAVNDRAVRV